jgi:hypothetical protein
VAASLVPDGELVRCETGNEDPDNLRFEADCERWLGRQVTLLKSSEYESVWDCWQRRRYMAGPDGAPCTMHMKVVPRLEYQRPDDIHVFGYSADAADVRRFEKLRDTYFELTVQAPLIEAGITKEGTLAIVERVGIKLPRTYGMGFPNANCLQSGCVKATSPAYWALYRHHFPEGFARTAALAKELGKKLVRIDNERVFLDELPADQPMTEPIVPYCDFLCRLSEAS